VSLPVAITPPEIHRELRPDEAYDRWAQWKVFERQVKQALADAKEEVTADYVAFLEEHGEYEAGDVRIYAGQQKKPAKCVDVFGLLQFLIDKTGGDARLIGELLAANAWTPGAVKKLDGIGAEAFESFFRQEEVNVVKEGKPARKKVVEVNTKYIQSGDAK